MSERNSCSLEERYIAIDQSVRLIKNERDLIIVLLFLKQLTEREGS